MLEVLYTKYPTARRPEPEEPVLETDRVFVQSSSGRNTFPFSCYVMLVEDTLRSSTQYLTAVRWEETAEHRAKTFHGLVLRGELRKAVRWITEIEKGGVLQPDDHCTKMGPSPADCWDRCPS